MHIESYKFNSKYRVLQTLFTVCFATFFLLYGTNPCLAEDVESLDAYREAKNFSALIGTYVQQSGDPAIVTAENGSIQLWYLVGGIASSSFRAKLPLEDSHTPSHWSRGYYHPEKTVTYNWTPNSIVETNAEESHFRREVEVKSLEIENGVLELRILRNQYKRKWFLGPWVEATDFFSGRSQQEELGLVLQKVSSNPIPLDNFFEIKGIAPSTIRVSDMSFEELVGVFGEERARDIERQIEAEKPIELEDLIIDKEGNVIRVQFPDGQGSNGDYQSVNYHSDTCVHALFPSED
jgi:hypothetical protein